MKHCIFTYRIGLVVLLVAIGIVATAHQRRGIVVAADTKLPIKDASIRWDNDSVTKTIWNGTFLIPKAYNRLTVSHPKYETHSMSQQKFVDTVYMLPSSRMLSEVIIYGNRRKRPDYIGISATDRQLIAAQTSGGANILGLLSLLAQPIRNKIQHNKQLKKMRKKQIIDNY